MAAKILVKVILVVPLSSVKTTNTFKWVSCHGGKVVQGKTIRVYMLVSVVPTAGSSRSFVAMRVCGIAMLPFAMEAITTVRQ